MVNQSMFSIKETRRLTDSVFLSVLSGDTSCITNPGQFINISLPGLFLRRPISVCDCDRLRGEVTIVYKCVGRGTGLLASLPAGTGLDVLTGLGNGYDLSRSGTSPVLIGGGVGIPPLYWLCKKLTENGIRPHVVLGFNTAAEAFLIDEFRMLHPASLALASADGSIPGSVKGFVTDALPESYSYFYACGPLPMLRAVCQTAAGSGELSFEERMGCGFGACMGCSILTASGSKRICKDGPVLRKEEIIW